jgi:hypothetical protein
MKKILIFAVLLLPLILCVTTNNYYGLNKLNFAGAYKMNEVGICFEIYKNNYTNNKEFKEIKEWFDEGCKASCHKVNKCSSENVLLIIKGNHKGNVISESDVSVSYDVIAYCYKDSYKTVDEAKNNCFGKKSKDEYNFTYYEK